jgi:hypothetical protein
MTMAFQKLSKLLNFKNLPPTPQPVFGVRLARNATEIPVVVRKAIAFFEKKGKDVLLLSPFSFLLSPF